MSSIVGAVGWWGVLGVLGVFGVLVVGCQTSRSHYESAPYRVLKKAGAFEVREYPSLHLVETPGSGRMEKRNTGFRKLFRYISGQNEAALKIPMTTPVFILAQTE